MASPMNFASVAPRVSMTRIRREPYGVLTITPTSNNSTPSFWKNRLARNRNICYILSTTLNRFIGDEKRIAVAVGPIKDEWGGQ